MSAQQRTIIIGAGSSVDSTPSMLGQPQSLGWASISRLDVYLTTLA
jgi:hypothetical protein